MGGTKEREPIIWNKKYNPRWWWRSLQIRHRCSRICCFQYRWHLYKSVQTSYNTYMCENVSREDTIFCEENQSTETEHNVIITSLSY